MARRYFDVIEGLKEAAARFRDKDVLRWTAIYMVGELLIMIAMFAAAIGAIVSSFSKGNGALALAGFSALLAGFVALVAFAMYAIPRAVRAAMKADGIKVAPKPPGVLEYFVFTVRLTLINLSCWYDKKLLAPSTALLAMAVLAAICALLAPALSYAVWVIAIVLFVFSLLAGMTGILVHAERTKFAVHMLLRGDGPESAMPLKSYGLVNGQTFEVYAAGALGGAWLYAVRMVIDIFSRVLMYALLVPVILVGGSAGSGAMLLVGIALVVLLFLAIIFAWAFIEMAVWRVYLADMFKFYDAMGPVKKTAGAPKKAAKKAKKR
ncbi:MAG: hypothetical protein V1728_05455 [Candidatus Micrarchaeota archaeon]